ncbi:MAG: twin-arginine translocase TatA/TatE family subunit [Clostridia bacterium]|nr:twin-arginine translocase TatA/TatE family subunit [Clostridia bacterium]
MNIGFGEFMVVLLIAYVIVGPKDLPKVARFLGRAAKRLKRLIRQLKEESGWNELASQAAQVRGDFEGAVRQADVSGELKKAKQTFDNIKREE